MTGTLLSLFSGYGGLDLAVESVLDVRTSWVADVSKGACKVLAHRFPHAPNVGDVTAVDWASLGHVDVIAGGSPCQDVSHAGGRAGMRDGTRSGLWQAMREAIAVTRPGLVVWENVRGALSAAADSDMEPCPGCVGDADDGPVLRALGRVLGDLASLGFDAEWVSLPASAVGCAHLRWRVFVVAWPAATDPGLLRRRAGWAPGPGQTEGGRALSDATGRSLPTRTTRDHKGHNQRRDTTCLTGALLPTPAVNDMGAGKDVAAWDQWRGTQRAKHGNGNGHGASLDIEVRRLLPTPRGTDGTKGGPNQRGSSGDLMLPSAVHRLTREKLCSSGSRRASVAPSSTSTSGPSARPAAATADAGSTEGLPIWGDYASAIARTEAVYGPAPDPTEPAPQGGRRLSCRFDEWLMGLPAGWITDTPGITHAETLALCANGVVPPQAALALTIALDRATTEAAA